MSRERRITEHRKQNNYEYIKDLKFIEFQNYIKNVIYICGSCGHDETHFQKFCNVCGSSKIMIYRTVHVCNNCESILEWGNGQYCPNCGHTVD